MNDKNKKSGSSGGIGIKLLNNNTDLSQIEMHELDWDVNIKGREWKCFRIPGYIHTIGGKWGENDYWVCPRDEIPTTTNLIEFNGIPVRYSIEINENNYIKSKWGESEARHSVSCHIKRNDKEFYCFACNDIAYAYAKAYQLIKSAIQEGVVNYSKYNFQVTEIIGRHIWWKRQPYTLCTYMDGQCCSMAVPGHIKMPFDYYENGLHGVKLDLLEDKHIGWFCPDY